MGWERVDAWPGESRGGAFRGSAEPVMAARRGVTWLESLRLFWRSSPEMPLERVAVRSALTPSHVYVERRDGSRERIDRAALRGARSDGPIEVYAVTDAEDLFLPRRDGCPLSSALDAQLGRGEPIVLGRGVNVGMVALPVVGGVASALLADHPPRDALANLRAGLVTSESALAMYWALGCLVVGLAVLLWIPLRHRIDRTGIERRRGLVPWLAFRVPAEQIEHVRAEARRGVGNGRRRVYGYGVVARLRRPRRVGSLTRLEEIELAWVPAPRPSDAVTARINADDLAARVALALDVPRSA